MSPTRPAVAPPPPLATCPHAEGSILSCDQLWRTHIEGQARVKAEQSSSTQTGEEQAALRRGLHAQIAAHAHFQAHKRSYFSLYLGSPRRRLGQSINVMIGPEMFIEYTDGIFFQSGTSSCRQLYTP
eukprot:scaffold26454_cov44-Phaeocystis_antarctica.AAC.1